MSNRAEYIDEHEYYTVLAMGYDRQGNAVQNYGREDTYSAALERVNVYRERGYRVVLRKYESHRIVLD